MRVGAWLAARGIVHRILVWRAVRPATGIQAAAREARYELLTGWCRQAGVLHLLLGHHRGDQAETVVLRQRRRSGPSGLAAMACVVERPSLRLLRPLLSISRAQLEATLRLRGQAWLEDPANRDWRFARTHLRQAMAHDPAQIEAAWAASEIAGRRRRRFEDALARFFVLHTAVHPAGFAVVEDRALAALKAPHRSEVLSRLVQLVAGSPYGPRGEVMERLSARFDAGPLATAATAGGCRLVPVRWHGARLVGNAKGPWLLVARELAAVDPPLALRPGEVQVWDGRYAVAVPATCGEGLVVGALGPQGREQVTAGISALPAVRPTLPALFRGPAVVAVPHLGLFREPALRAVGVRFRPRRPLAEAGFAAFSA
jgi:tRNA(Ile)-lysidine synthase